MCLFFCYQVARYGVEIGNYYIQRVILNAAFFFVVEVVTCQKELWDLYIIFSAISSHDFLSQLPCFTLCILTDIHLRIHAYAHTYKHRYTRTTTNQSP